jgi:hypothetical protein
VGRSVTCTTTVRAYKSSSGRVRIRGAASASNGAGASVRTTDSSRLVIVTPRSPRVTG